MGRRRGGERSRHLSKPCPGKRKASHRKAERLLVTDSLHECRNARMQEFQKPASGPEWKLSGKATVSCEVASESEYASRAKARFSVAKAF